MPQIIVDTAKDSPALIRKCADFLREVSLLMDMERLTDVAVRNAPAAPVPAQVAAPPPAAPAVETAPELPNPADIFGGNVAPVVSVPAWVKFPSSAPVVSADPTPTVTIDRDGVKWDERIHSSAKSFTADGRWKKRRNLPEETYQAVMAELRGQVQIPMAAPEAIPAVVPTPPTVVDAPIVADVPPPPPVTVSPPSAAAPAITPSVPANETPQPIGVSYAAVVQRAIQLQQTGKLTKEKCDEIIMQTAGVAGLTPLISRPDTFPAVLAALNAAAGT